MGHAGRKRAPTSAQNDSRRLYTYKFCSPSRSALLTGRLPMHVNLHNLPLYVPRAGIPLGMTTIAEKLKQAGYATHAVGKWHCGMARLALALSTPASLPSFLVLAWACLRRAGRPMGVCTASRAQSTCGGRVTPHFLCPQASAAQTPTGRGFDSYLGYFDGYNDYLHSWSGYHSGAQNVRPHSCVLDLRHCHGRSRKFRAHS